MIPIRDDAPSWGLPVVTWSLIAANCLVFLYEVSLPQQELLRLFYQLGVVPARYTDPPWAGAVGLASPGLAPFATSMFLHGGLLHLLVNMWALWIFGDNVEDRMGGLRFIVFYLLCGVVAAVAHVVANPDTAVPTVGASGAIAGVLGAYFVLYPFARVLVLVPIFFWPVFFHVPAVAYLLLWFLLQLMSGTASVAADAAAGGVAWWAHVGGFASGIVLVPFFVRRGSRGRR